LKSFSHKSNNLGVRMSAGLISDPPGNTVADKPVTGLIDLVTGGFGGTLTSIGIVIILGVIMGYFLEKTGAALVMARNILKLVGKKIWIAEPSRRSSYSLAIRTSHCS
jgi:hypothetical protein